MSINIIKIHMFLERQRRKLMNEKTMRKKNILDCRTNNIKFKKTIKKHIDESMKKKLEERNKITFSEYLKKKR